ncbi:MAG: ImmA/IrrE family metallo-endopeptidase [Planctomycetota bacterium]
MIPRVIRNESDHAQALKRIEAIFNAVPGTPEGDELDLLVTLVELYEQKSVPMEAPDPISAIRFRMDQQGLRSKDLVPFLGSPSKVSEVLSGRRRLSLTMIRKLNEGLQIPVESLVGSAPFPSVSNTEIEWTCFPLKQMFQRGWFEGFRGTYKDAKEIVNELLNEFTAPLRKEVLSQAFTRQHIRSGSSADKYALLAWEIRVIKLAMRESLPDFDPKIVSADFIKELVRLSYFDTGPLIAREFLQKAGIHLIVEPHLKKTFIDGAAMSLPDGSPVIALTLRYDRLDNYWFTLLHELIHVARHLKDDNKTFFDDLTEANTDRFETEADAIASDALVPKELLEDLVKGPLPSVATVKMFANKLKIHPSIPAGRIRFERGNYRILNSLVKGYKVRQHFTCPPSY